MKDECGRGIGIRAIIEKINKRLVFRLFSQIVCVLVNYREGSRAHSSLLHLTVLQASANKGSC